jgi:hypothetical protein
MGVRRRFLNTSMVQGKTTGLGIYVPCAPNVLRELKKKRIRKASLTAFLVS